MGITSEARKRREESAEAKLKVYKDALELIAKTNLSDVHGFESREESAVWLSDWMRHQAQRALRDTTSESPAPGPF